MMDASGCCFDKECMMKCVGLMLVRGESCVLQVGKSAPTIPYSLFGPRPMQSSLSLLRHHRFVFFCSQFVVCHF